MTSLESMHQGSKQILIAAKWFTVNDKEKYVNYGSKYRWYVYPDSKNDINLIYFEPPEALHLIM